VDDSALKRRGIVKFLFWTAVAVIVTMVAIRSYTSGQMTGWFYHRAAGGGYAVNVDLFRDANKAAPARLQIVNRDTIEGPVAVRVKKGDLLPRNTNGVISDKIIKEGKRAVVVAVDGVETLEVREPWKMEQAKGFKFKDTFKHKGVETWPWAAVWNVCIVLILGLALGLMAEGFTDMLGIRLEKIQHHTGSKGSHV
jgi:hypothetical protein